MSALYSENQFLGRLVTDLKSAEERALHDRDTWRYLEFSSTFVVLLRKNIFIVIVPELCTVENRVNLAIAHTELPLTMNA